MAIILLVEDDEQVRVLAESFLQSAGHSTLTAASSEQALSLLSADDPVDLLFVDVILQGDAEAGLSLAKKAIELRPDLKVLYTSGQALTDGMTSLFVPNSAYLPKPYTVEQLGTMLSMKFDLRASSPPNGSKVGASETSGRAAE
jgi:two-component system cell cycle sensor histidine kinase/response regulator CckA